MSRGLHGLYLSVIGVLIAAIGWLVLTDVDQTQHHPASIAVLPFVAMGMDESTNRLSDSVTDKVVTALAQNSQLRIAARSETRSIIRSELEIAAIGKTLAVAKVVEGSVRETDDGVRITAQLVDVASDEHLWSSTYERTVGDLDAVVADIASNVARFSHE